MTIGITVGGKQVVVPGTYSTFSVEDSLANITPGARNILLIGEAEKGIPGSQADLRGLAFTDYNTLKAYYGAGTICDAARMVFTNQPSPVFGGAVGTVYVYKTNESGLAEKNVMQGANLFGAINSAEYGEAGNMIKSQIVSATTEVLPTLTSYWVPRNVASDFNVRVNGGVEQTVTVAAELAPSDVAVAINALTGVAASGGAYRQVMTPAQVAAGCKLAVAVSGSRATITIFDTTDVATTFLGTDIASVVAGDVLYIPNGSAIKGSASKNIGAYSVVSASTTQIVADKIASSFGGVEVAPVQPEAVANTVLVGDQSLIASAEVIVFSPIVVTVDAATNLGTGASLEIYNTSGDKNIAQRFYSFDSFKNPVSATVAISARVSVAVAANVGTFGITSGSFQNVPAINDVLWISQESVLSGTNDENCGAWIVTAAGSTTIKARKVIDGGVTVASVILSGQEKPFVVQGAVASTSFGGKAIVSSSEKQVYVKASRQTDGTTFPQTNVGGKIVLELAYTGSAACTVSISKAKVLTTACTNSADNLTINLNMFSTLGDLVSFINTKTGYAAKVTSLSYNSYNPKLQLDEVNAVTMAGGVSGSPAYNCRIKSDYYDFKALMDANIDLIAFAEEASLAHRAGLPTVESTGSFLSGGSLGATSNASILAAFDAAMKIEVVQVVPLFSRDAADDIADGLTDLGSSYSIESINQAAKAHVITASNDINRKERFAVCSIHESFENVKLHAASLSNERVQIAFQMGRATDSNGSVKWTLPFMEAVCIAAGRVQSALGTSMLRKSFALADIKHLGKVSVYSDSRVLDFDPDTTDLDSAIEAGCLALRAVTGFGIRMESPDESTRSRVNDPKSWVFERVNVLFVCDSVKKTCRDLLDNYIGNRTSDVTAATIKSALANVLDLFIKNGSLLNYSVDSVVSTGNGYECKIAIIPVECVEFVTIDVVAKRAV
jgi:hypothetical protein